MDFAQRITAAAKELRIEVTDELIERVMAIYPNGLGTSLDDKFELGMTVNMQHTLLNTTLDADDVRIKHEVTACIDEVAAGYSRPYWLKGTIRSLIKQGLLPEDYE